MVANFGAALPAAQVTQALAYILDRLKNQVTRVMAMRALTQIVASSQSVSVASILSDATTTICGYMRIHSQNLKHESVIAMTALVKQHGTYLFVVN